MQETRHKATQDTSFDWKEFGESMYFLHGERGLQERIHFVELRYRDRAEPIVEAMIEGAKQTGRDGDAVETITRHP